MIERTLRQARLIVGGSWLNLLGFSVLLIWLDLLDTSVPWVRWIGGLAGIVAPAIGYRIYRAEFEPPAGADREAIHTEFLKRNRSAIRVTEIGGFLGLLAWTIGGDPVSLTGLATHTLLAGAIWPTPERLANFAGEAES